MIFMRDSNFFGTKFLKDQTSWGPNFSGLGDQMRLWTFSAIAIFSYIYRSVNSRNIWFGLLHIIIILKYSYVLLCILMVWGKMINVSAFHIRKQHNNWPQKKKSIVQCGKCWHVKYVPGKVLSERLIPSDYVRLLCRTE